MDDFNTNQNSESSACIKCSGNRVGEPSCACPNDTRDDKINPYCHKHFSHPELELDYKVIDFKNNENSKSNKICENSPLDFDFCREYRISFSKIFK